MGLFFFFFQAEDGIRDLIVTGVQTCALPISARRFASASSVSSATRPRSTYAASSSSSASTPSARARAATGKIAATSGGLVSSLQAAEKGPSALLARAAAPAQRT